MISPFAVCSTGCDQGLIANNKMPLGRVAFFVSIDINPLLNFRYATCGSICASHSICAVAQEGFISYRMAKPYIAFAVGQVYRVRESDISLKIHGRQQNRPRVPLY